MFPENENKLTWRLRYAILNMERTVKLTTATSLSFLKMRKYYLAINNIRHDAVLRLPLNIIISTAELVVSAYKAPI